MFIKTIFFVSITSIYQLDLEDNFEKQQVPTHIQELLVASPIWIMSTLKAKELHESHLASATELYTLSGISHGILKPLNILLQEGVKGLRD
jgi:hypothetical protein